MAEQQGTNGNRWTTITIGGMNGNFELNVYLPVMADALLSSIQLLANGSATFSARCVEGIEADVEACEASVERNLAICTSLAPVIGYDRAAAISKTAFKTGQTVREVALEQGVLDEAELARLLEPTAMTKPQD